MILIYPGHQRSRAHYLRLHTACLSLSVGSIFMLSSMMIVMHLSFKNVTDFSMLVFGNIVFAIHCRALWQPRSHIRAPLFFWT